MEHPFALLTNRRSDVKGVIETTWESEHPRTGKKIRGRWEVEGGSKYGLPGPLEERLYLVLMEMTREQSWPQRVYFARGDVLRRLGMGESVKDYAKIEEAFVRLQHVSIRSENAFWDNGRQDYLKVVSFSILNDVVISAETPGRRGQGQLPLSSFEWHQLAWESMKRGHVRSVDLHFALSLSLPLAIRLYRYLGKHRHGKTVLRKGFEIEIHKLCEVHLGMVVSPHVSVLKQRLQGAHQELIERGFLTAVSFRTSKSKPGTKVVYAFAAGLEAEIPLEVAKPQGAGDLSHLQAVIPARISAEIETGQPIYPNEAFAVFNGLKNAEKDKMREMARREVEPAFWDRLEKPDSPMALVLWEIVVREFPALYAAELEK